MKDKKDLPVICCEGEAPECGCGPAEQQEQNYAAAGYPWQIGLVKTPVGPVPRVATALERKDIVGGWKARWGMGRMDYRIPPGLYAVGEPDHNSPVLVSGNYKLSFDSLRRELSPLNLWLIIIDTKGINVWCAAGKGSFGTAELVQRIGKVCLKDLVGHREIILPQLAAPGVSAHKVFKQSGFKVVYGPVRASDIPAFLQMGCKATPHMRQVSFALRERLQVIPVELVSMTKPVLGIFLALLLLNSLVLLRDGTFPASAILLGQTLAHVAPFLGAILIGTVLVPVLLPYIPGRAFAWKGFVLGVLWTLAFVLFIAPAAGWLQMASYFLLLPAIAAFLSMNFTGASTYTSLSGVVKEMSLALPVIVISAGLGICGFIVSLFV